MIPDSSTSIVTAAAGVVGQEASSVGTVCFRPTESGLQPEGRHPARGVAASGFRVRKIPHCCLP